MQYRYLDLRRSVVRRNLELRHKMAFEVRRYLDELNFLEVETPVLIKSTPEGARDFVVPSRMNPGETVIDGIGIRPLFPNREMFS